MTPHLARPVSVYGNCIFDVFFFLPSAWAEVGVKDDEDDIWGALTRSEYFYRTGGPVQIDENADLATVGGTASTPSTKS